MALPTQAESAAIAEDTPAAEQLAQLTALLAEKCAEIECLEGRLERVTTDWAELDEQAAAMQDKLAACDSTIARQAGEYLDEASRNAELDAQVGALQAELAALRTQQRERLLARDRDIVTLFQELPALIDEEDLKHAGTVRAARLVAAGAALDVSAAAIRQALAQMIDAWGDEMEAMRGTTAEFEKTSVAELDARIAEISRHKDALARLSPADLKNWHSATFTRRTLGGTMDDLLRLADTARSALRAVRIALDKDSDVFVLGATLLTAHALVERTRFLDHSDMRGFQYYEVDGNLSRTFYAVEAEISEMLATGKRYSAPPDDNHGHHLAPEWRVEIPEADAGPDAFDAGATPEIAMAIGFESIDHGFDDFAVNPANGIPMIGGIGGTDWYGNTFNTDTNDPW